MSALIALLFIKTAMALTPPAIEIWGLGHEFYPMERDTKTKVLISSGCEKKGNKCEAYKVLHTKRDFKLTPEDLVGGKNPGSVKCSKFLKGTVLILRDNEERENAFCKFPDGSLVSASSL